MNDHVDVHTLRTLGAPYRETFSSIPEFPGHPAVIRHALTPVLALDAVGAGNFSWLLLGDDDTIFVLPAVLRMLNKAKLSAEDPHEICDFIVPVCKTGLHSITKVAGQKSHCSQVRRLDPRCLPCPRGGPRLCPCKLPPGCTQSDNWSTENCTSRARYGGYGGVGIIYSVGMLRLMTQDPSFYMSLVFRDVVPAEPYGDRPLSDGPRRLGYGLTDITAAVKGHPEDVRYFGPQCHLNDHRSPLQMLEALQQSYEQEPAVFRDTVSFHMRTRSMHNHNISLSGYLSAYRKVVDLFLRAHGQ